MLEMEHDGIKEYVNPILRNAKRLQRLTEDLLDVATIESHTLKLNREKFNLNELISHAIEDAKNQIGYNKKISIFYNNKGEDLIIEGDKGRLTQVLCNLIGNAIKFTNEGTITINSELKCCSNSNSDNATYQVIISVTDTGKGIDSQIFPGLFSKFASKSKGEGTGLGLFICKGIVESHGGKIWAENNCNGKKGCTFCFSIPTKMV
jgi:signal transduction histidine kinase